MVKSKLNKVRVLVLQRLPLDQMKTFLGSGRGELCECVRFFGRSRCMRDRYILFKAERVDLVIIISSSDCWTV